MHTSDLFSWLQLLLISCLHITAWTGASAIAPCCPTPVIRVLFPPGKYSLLLLGKDTPSVHEEAPHQGCPDCLPVPSAGPCRGPIHMAGGLPPLPAPPSGDTSPFPSLGIMLKLSRHKWSPSNIGQTCVSNLKRKNSCFTQGYSKSQRVELWSWKGPSRPCGILITRV